LGRGGVHLNPGQAWRGKHFNIPAVGLIKPATPGGPPIYLGAGAPPGLRRAAKYGDGFVAVALKPPALASLKQKLQDLRAQFGGEGPFPFLAQAAPPATMEDAKQMRAEYQAAGVDGLILTYDGELPDAFLSTRDAVQALLDS